MDIISLLTLILGSNLVSGLVTFFITKKKYNSEVDSNLIRNMQESLEFYKKLSDDNKERLDIVLKRNEELEKDMSALKNEMIKFMSSVCTDLTCQARKRNLELFKEINNGTIIEKGNKES